MILITGGTGFLGSYIIRQLIEKGYQVRAIRRSHKLPPYVPNEIFDKVEWVDGDVLDVVSLEDAMNGVDTVIHAAAIVSFISSEKKQMYKINVEGTANVVNIALEKNIRRFVHISSIAALSRMPDGGHVNEERKWEDNKTNTHYARSKYKAELEVWRGISEGLNAVILNPSTILGYGDWTTGSSAIFKKVYDEFKWFTPGINGFVDVEDVAAATVLLMESDISEQRFIISGDNWPFRRLMNTMADSFGKKKPVKQTTALLLGMAWRAEKLRSMITGSKPILTRESAKVAHSKTYFDNGKFLQAFPRFSFTPLDQTIRKACEKYLLAHRQLQQ
jgi:nucleoside-diphosphate-sugar epimerase